LFCNWPSSLCSPSGYQAWKTAWSRFPDNWTDENALRRIVRSELLAFRDSVAAAPENAENPEPSIDPAENAYRLDAVQEELSYHIERGEISELDMTNLQAEIARLDPDSRTMMMRELVSALNSGDLKGRL
jgi:hypothetical protein